MLQMSNYAAVQYLLFHMLLWMKRIHCTMYVMYVAVVESCLMENDPGTAR